MVKKCVILSCFIFQFLWASESGVLAFRAKQSVLEGRFAKAYSQLEKALLASRKESNLQAEGRVLMAMAQIRIQSLDYDFADSLLSLVDLKDMDSLTLLAHIHARLKLFNARERYEESLSTIQSLDFKQVKKAPKTLQAGLYAEYAFALFAQNKNEDAEKVLEKAKKTMNMKKGQWSFLLGRIALIQKEYPKADSLFLNAYEKSIAQNEIYYSASVLYLRAQVALAFKENVQAKSFLKRSANASELLGLQNNEKRSLDLLKDLN